MSAQGGPTPDAVPDETPDRSPSPTETSHDTRDDLETTMTSQQPSDADRPDSGTGADRPDGDTGADRPDPTLSSHLGWPDATAPLPQATTALPQATTALPQATTALPQATGPAAPTPAAPHRVEPTAPVPDDASTSWPPPQPLRPEPAPTAGPGITVRRGPRPGTVMFGLLAMIVSAYVLVANLTDVDLSFRLVGPPLVGAFGGMLLLVGLAGVVAGRLRR